MLLEKIHLEDDEKVLRMIRKHWFIIVVELVGLGFLALAPIAIEVFLHYAAADGTYITPEQVASWQPYLIFGSAFWLLMLIMAAAAAWTHYYLDLWIITTKRVVLIDQRGFFRRFVSSFRLERLQDINIEINGIIPTLLNFGTVEAQTAGASHERFVGYNMPDPRAVKATIIRSAEEVTRKQSALISTLKEQGL